VCDHAEENNFRILLPLAREYQMEGLTERIDEYLVRSEKPSTYKLFMAEEYSLLASKQKYLEFAER